MANVTPLCQKEGKQNMGDLRPVSLISVIGKILEFVVKDKIVEYLEVHGKMGWNRHGFIKGLDKGIESIVAKFVDDTKVDGEAGSVEEMGLLQKDLDRLGEMAKKWQTEYNLGTCQIMHFGQKIR
eukprot:g31055.t1